MTCMLPSPESGQKAVADRVYQIGQCFTVHGVMWVGKERRRGLTLIMRTSKHERTSQMAVNLEHNQSVHNGRLERY